MDIVSEKISKLVFKRNIDQDIGEISLDAQMLKVLSTLDGKKDVMTVASTLNMRIIELKSVLSKLFKHKLIIKVKKSEPVLDRGFFDFMESCLAEAMGPIAKVLIKDTVNDLGESMNAFPKSHAAELVRSISSKIFIEDKKQDFLRKMKPKLS